MLGLTGLHNIGNTCFLNTSLQCISNCPEFMNYILNDHYYKEINIDNPIGSGGSLIKSFANLMKSMWYDKKPVADPVEFKKCLEKFHTSVR